MKKVLIITYDWPPQGSVGMIRAVRFAKYLKRAGHEVTVVTRESKAAGTVKWDLAEPEIERMPVVRLEMPPDSRPDIYMENKLNPQFEAGFFHAAAARMDNLLREIEFDVIVSSSPPESVHAVAAEIKRRRKVSWIADLRDLWSSDHYRGLDFFRTGIARYRESRILRRADMLVTVSENWAGLLKRRYGSRVRIIPNGYDEEASARIPLYRQEKFMITYTGKLNGEHQDINPFLEGLKMAIEEGSIPEEGIKVEFYVSGYGKPDIMAIVRDRGLTDIITEHGPVPFGRSLGMMKNSSLLLLVGWKGPSSTGWRPQKLCEYMGSGAPILLVNGSENTELKAVVGSIPGCRAQEDAAGIKSALMEYYKAFQAGAPVRIDTHKGAAGEYTARNMAESLSRVIEEVTAR